MKPHEYVILEVARERERQMSVEGWTPAHDNEHDREELARAASCYASPEPIFVHRDEECAFFSGNDGGRGDRGLQREGYYPAWPWDAEWDKRGKHDRRRQLVIAAALITAEIERLDRANK